MTSNRSYMMSNVSRRRRRAQRRNVIIAVLVVGGLIAIGVYAISGGGDQAPPIENPIAQTAPVIDDRPPAQNAGTPFGPSNASAATALTTPPTQQSRAQQSGALPDPEPIVRRDEPRRPDPANAAVIEMGTPVVSTTPARDAQSATRQPEPEPQTEQPRRSSTSGVLPGVPTVSNTGLSDLIARADALVAQSKPIEARDILNRALFDRSTTEGDRETLRERIQRINETLVFSRAVAPGDKVSRSYTIGPGDSLAKIASNEKTDADWRLIAQINGISDPRRIRVGQSVKLLQGPFHAVVYKSRFRLDLFASATDSAGNRLFIRSFPVGLGEFGSTPTGSFVVRPQSKLINPVWTNPRTGEYFGADNPENPIGEHWIGLDPADDASASFTQYGLHGTIDPGSIGQEKSMGCVRLAAPDIELLYGLLVENKSTVEILP
jgi:LysM repeat protein